MYIHVFTAEYVLNSDVGLQIMWNVESRHGPVLEVFEVEGTRERRLVIGYKMGGTSGFFRWVSDGIYFSQKVKIVSLFTVHCPIYTISILSIPRENTLVSYFQVLL